MKKTIRRLELTRETVTNLRVRTTVRTGMKKEGGDETIQSCHLCSQGGGGKGPGEPTWIPITVPPIV